MSEDEKIIVSAHERSRPKPREKTQELANVAPQAGPGILDAAAAKAQAITDPQKRVSDPQIVGGGNVEKKGVTVVSRHSKSS